MRCRTRGRKLDDITAVRREDREMPMPLHARESVRSSLGESVHVSERLAKAPKYRFPTEEWEAEDAFKLISDELMLDGNSRQNLATFCQTWEEPQVHALMDLAIDK